MDPFIDQETGRVNNGVPVHDITRNQSSGDRISTVSDGMAAEESDSSRSSDHSVRSLPVRRGLRKMVRATPANSLPGNRRDADNTTALPTSTPIQQRVQAMVEEECVPPEYRIRPPLVNNAESELLAYLRVKLGVSRISMASHAQAARFAEGWFKQYRPGYSFTTREAVTSKAIARLVEESPLDVELQDSFEPGSDTWIGRFLSVRRPVSVEIEQRIADLNLVRSGYRLEKANWVQRAVGHIIVPSTIGTMAYLTIKVASLPLGSFKWPAVLAMGWCGYEMVAKSLRQRSELLNAARRVVPEK